MGAVEENVIDMVMHYMKLREIVRQLLDAWPNNDPAFDQAMAGLRDALEVDQALDP